MIDHVVGLSFDYFADPQARRAALVRLDPATLTDGPWTKDASGRFLIATSCASAKCMCGCVSKAPIRRSAALPARCSSTPGRPSADVSCRRRDRNARGAANSGSSSLVARDDGTALIVALMAMMLLLPLGGGADAHHDDGDDNRGQLSRRPRHAVCGRRGHRACGQRASQGAQLDRCAERHFDIGLDATIAPAGAPPRDENGHPWRLYASGRLADMLGDASGDSQVHGRCVGRGRSGRTGRADRARECAGGLARLAATSK